jgi:hypothetical protein
MAFSRFRSSLPARAEGPSCPAEADSTRFNYPQDAFVQQILFAADRCNSPPDPVAQAFIFSLPYQCICVRNLRGSRNSNSGVFKCRAVQEMTQQSQVARAPYAFEPPKRVWGPPGDWDALLRTCALWTIAVVGFGVGAAGFVSASRNAVEAKALVEKSNQLLASVEQKSDLADRVAALSEQLKQGSRDAATSGDLAARQAQIEQSLERLATKIDAVAADLQEKAGVSVTRLDKLDEALSNVQLRLAKDEASAAAASKTLSAPAPPSEPPAPAATPASRDQDDKYALSHYAIVSIEKASVKLSGPDGIIVVTKGDKLPGGQRILRFTKYGAQPGVITDHGDIALKATP